MLRTASLFVMVSLIVLGGLAGAPAPTPTPVPAYIFYWSRLDNDITVQPTGDLRVVETWRLTFVKGNFSSGSRTFDLGAGQDVRDVAIAVDGVALTEDMPKGDQSGTFTVIRDQNQVRLNWYYPSARSPSSHTFVVTYTAVGMLSLGAATDELMWDAVWASHSIPVLAAETTVHLPEGAPASRAHTEGGAATFKIDAAGPTVTFTASGALRAQVGLRVFVDFPHLVRPETPGEIVQPKG